MNQMARAIDGQQHFLVPDVRCAGCCLKIERELNKLMDIDQVNVNYADKRLSFQAGSHAVVEHVISRLKELGYPASPDSESEGLQLYRSERRGLLARLGVAGIGMMQVMMFALASYLAGPGGIDESYQALLRWASLVIALPVVLYAAQPFHRGALRDLRNLSPGMDVPVSLAICCAFTLSAFNTIAGTGEVYFDSACMFTFFLLSGRFLELAARHTFQVEQSLGDHLLPELARLADGSFIQVAELRTGSRVIVEPGETLPGDGYLISGESSIDESAFTGETRPVIKTPGSKVLAGSKNLDGSIEYEVEGSSSDWVITHLGELYRKTAAYRPRFAMMADVIARYFVAVVLILSAGTGVYWWLQGSENYFAIALAVLVVSCPCALSLATPVAYSIASGAVRRIGVLVKSGEFLEKLSGVKTVVFDKTGTLTEGRLQLESIVLLEEGMTEAEALATAAALEQNSLHPVAATLREAADAVRTMEDLQIVPGKGVSGCAAGEVWRLGKPEFSVDHRVQAPDGNFNWVLMSRDGHGICWFAFRDRWREGSDKVVTRLRDEGFRLEVYSGDSSSEGRDGLIAIGIESPVMNMSPNQKISALGRLQTDGQQVLMVGDGLNDAGAMALADISLAVNPVDTMVQAAADATLVSGDIEAVPKLVKYAARVKKIIRQNLTWALIYNFTVIPLAIAGLVAPWVAALGMSMSSLLVTLNACRLGRVS
jgi:Cu2+-exporting ATPase